MAMQCEVCGGKPSEGVDLYRVNPKGVAGIWRCSHHFAADPSLVRIVETLSRSPADVMARRQDGNGTRETARWSANPKETST